MKTQVKLKNLRISPRKTRIAAGALKGMDVSEALVEARHMIKRSGVSLEKLLRSAVSSAENNFGLDKDNLYVRDIQVGEGARLKRWLPRAYGRATPIIKRSCHVFLTLEERVEGKNRKSKEQLEKERREREAARKKLEKQAEKENEAAMKKEEKTKERIVSTKPKKEIIEKREEKKNSKEGWMSKVFRRKSM